MNARLPAFPDQENVRLSVKTENPLSVYRGCAYRERRGSRKGHVAAISED